MSARAPAERAGGLEIKLCGLRTEAGARACASAGVQFAGLNFAPGSRRRIAPEQGLALRAALGSVTAVGVFRDQDLATITAIAAQVGLRWLQLHGDEPLALAAQLAERHHLIRALPETALDDQALLAAWAPLVRRFVIDGREPGSGQGWDHARLERAGLRGGRLHGVGVWLAGGLTPLTVGEAIRRVRPAGVDAASGIEQDGRESPERIAAFARAAWEAAASAADVAPKEER